MEIKSSADIVREALQDDDGTPDCMSFMDEQKKWIAVDDIIKMLKDWNCRNNKETKVT